MREEYTILLESLVCYGYLLVVMNYSYDGSLIKFLDRSLAAALGITETLSLSESAPKIPAL